MLGASCRSQGVVRTSLRVQAVVTRLRHAAIDRMSDTDVRWRSLGGLFLAGGTLALVSLLPPADEGTQASAIVGVGVCAVLTGSVLVAFATRLPHDDRW